MPGDKMSGGPKRAEEINAALDRVRSMEQRFKDQEERMAMLLLTNQALWELVRDRVGIQDTELLEKIRELDLRDGSEDGRLADVEIVCAACNHKTNSRNKRCVYCGEAVEALPDMPVFYRCWRR